MISLMIEVNDVVARVFFLHVLDAAINRSRRSAECEQVARSVAAHLLAAGALVLIGLSAMFPADAVCKPSNTN